MYIYIYTHDVIFFIIYRDMTLFPYINHDFLGTQHVFVTNLVAGHLWWQPEDFVNFLRSRLDIAEAYKAAAHSLGVETWR